ncbi:MAG: TonB-dependent receptor, partial [Bacteroidetes bacterium]
MIRFRTPTPLKGLLSAACLAAGVLTSPVQAQTEYLSAELAGKASVAEEAPLHTPQAVTMLDQVLDDLADRFEVNFVYESKWVKNRPVEAEVNYAEDLTRLLDQLLPAYNLNFRALNPKTYVIFPAKGREVEVKPINRAPAQEPVGNMGLNIQPNPIAPVRTRVFRVVPEVIAFTVSGVVTDGNGAPLEGAVVVASGTRRGTLTDAQGRFSLQLEDDQKNVTLVVSYYGFVRQEVPLNGRSSLEIALEPEANALDEVVVIGYGSKQRRDITGAVASVSSEELQAVVVQSLDQAMQGRAPGVVVTQNSGEPGGNVSVRIRGVGSTGNNEPLYVIDGFPLYNDNGRTGSAGFSDTQFNALASLNPNDIESIEILKDASAAAIYGARAANGVVIITTKRGRSGAAKVSFDSYVGVQEAWRVPEFLNAEEFATIANEAYENADLDPNPEWANPASLGEGTDWLGQMYRRGVIQDYNVGIRGGTDRTQASVSLGYFNQEGILIESGFERFSMRTNIDFQANDKLRFGVSSTSSFSEQQIIRTNNFANGAYNIAMMMYPTIELDGFVDGPAQYYSAALDNPVLRAQTEPSFLTTLRSMTTAYGEWDILPGLTYRVNVGADVIASRSTRWVPSYKRGLVNQVNASSWERRTEDITWLVENTLTYQNNFGGKHDFLAMVGQSAQKSNFSSISASGDGFQNNEIRVISASNPDLRGAGGDANQWALASYFGRMNYTFDDRFLATATLRVDGSSRFGPNNKWGVFPSFSAGWRVSNEAFMQNVDAIDDLKVRASWGQLGSDRIGDFRYLNIYETSNVEYTFNETGLPGAVLARLGNPDLRWETSTQTDIGVDVSLWEGRLYGTIDYFIKTTEDLLVSVPIPLTVGIGNSPVQNAGAVTNRGLELAIGTQGGNADFSYDVSVNFATINNIVDTLGSGQPIAGGSFAGADRFQPTRTEAGFPIGYFFGFEVDGIYNTESEIDRNFAPLAQPGDFRFVDANGDGVLTDDDRVFLGSPIPDFTYGLNVNLRYKAFDFNLFLQGVHGNEIFNTLKQQVIQVPYFNGSGVTNSLTAVLDRWTPENTWQEGDPLIPRVSYNDPNGNFPRASSFYVEDGSFMRVRNLTVGYTLPTTVGAQIGISRLRLYAGAQNLLTFTNYSGFDPEIGDFNQNALASGVD